MPTRSLEERCERIQEVARIVLRTLFFVSAYTIAATLILFAVWAFTLDVLKKVSAP